MLSFLFKSSNSDENQFQKRKKYRVKKPRLRTEPWTDENTDEEGQEATPLAKVNSNSIDSFHCNT